MAKRKAISQEWEKAMGDRIKVLRQAKGLTQDQLARAAGLSLDSLRSWEQGRTVPHLDLAAQLAQVLGCTLGQLGGTEPMPTAEGKGKGKGRKSKEG